MSEPAVNKEIASTAPDIDAEAELAIMICDGDARAALRATLVANAYLEAELDRVKEMVSAGYGRGQVHAAPRRRAAANKANERPQLL